MKKAKFKHNYASTIYLEVIGSGALGAPRSVYIFTEHCRYLFNCGEGTQRLASEHKVKLSLLEHVFITHKSWENVGGLPGALLTLQDTGVPKITIHGPPGIESIYNDTKHFMRFSSLKLNHVLYEEKEALCNEGPMKVEMVALWPDNIKANNIEDSSIEVLEEEEDLQDMFSHERSTFIKKPRVELNNEVLQKKKDELEQSIHCRDLSVAYICTPVEKPGALLPSRCRLLGVPPGPLWGDLKSGCAVDLPDGRRITAEEVTEITPPSPVFLVIEVPTLLHLRSLLSNQRLRRLQPGGGDGSTLEGVTSSSTQPASVILHFSPEHVVEDDLYQKWCDEFGVDCTHIFLNEANSCMGSERVHRVQHKLNLVYPSSFPLLRDEVECESDYLNDDHPSKRVCTDSTIKNMTQETPSKTGKKSTELAAHVRAFTRLTYNIRPHTGIDKRLRRIRINPREFIAECHSSPAFEEALRRSRTAIDGALQSISPSERDQEFPNLAFLGTGSCIPNKTRNTSGIVLNIKPSCSMLLDCGEGSFGQLVRMLGPQQSASFLRGLVAVYVSHLHADHHIGLIRIILARQKAFIDNGFLPPEIPKLYLLAPAGIRHYLLSYSVHFEPIAEMFTLVSNACFLEGFSDTKLSDSSTLRKSEGEDISHETTLQDCQSALGVRRVATCRVRHCPDAFGVSITLDREDGFTVAYSGDTRPCDALVDLAKGCSLLIHEATMEDALSEDAILKRHCTISEAVAVASRMGAKHTILTHFSQRYAKLPLLGKVVGTEVNEAEGGTPHNVSIAFDNMIIHLSDLPCLPLLYGAYLAVFSDDVDEMIKKSEKIKLKRELNDKT